MHILQHSGKIHIPVLCTHSSGVKLHLIKCGSYTQALRPLVGKTTQACTVSDQWLAISRA